MERTTVRLPDVLLEQAKDHARRTGRTFTQLLEHAVRAELALGSASARVAERTPDMYASGFGGSGGNFPVTSQPELSVEQRERSAKQLLDQVQELQAFLMALPDLDRRPADDILGYNASGLPE